MKKIFAFLICLASISSLANALPAKTCGALSELTEIVATWRDDGNSPSVSQEMLSNAAQAQGIDPMFVPFVVNFVYGRPSDPPSALSSAIFVKCSAI